MEGNGEGENSLLPGLLKCAQWICM